MKKEKVRCKNKFKSYAIVIVQKWAEYERDEGQRPVGYSLHLTEADRAKFEANRYKNLPRSYVPDIYVRTSGDPYIAEVDKVAFNKVVRAKKKYGLRFYDNKYPNSGGSNSWVPISNVQKWEREALEMRKNALKGIK